MAIDTRDKRASVINIAAGFIGILPLPDGTIDQQDRAVLARLYDGIVITSDVIVSTLMKAITLQTVGLTALPFKNPVLKHEYTE